MLKRRRTRLPLNYLPAPWSGPFGGIPNWNQVQVEDFRSTLDQAIADALAEIDVIAQNPSQPTFANTIIPLEQAAKPPLG